MVLLYPKFLLKTVLYGLAGGGFGYNRYLHQFQNPGYNHERDKHPVRNRHNRTAGWKEAVGTLRQRQYESYDEYVTHQRQKYREILQVQGGFSTYTIVAWRQKFFRRFKHLAYRLPRTATIICLGARQGTEVEVLQDLGFQNAYGVDLNPGPNNPYVRPGDFMHLQESDASVDALYTNSLDHAFDLEVFIREHVRVLTKNGYAIYDLPRYSTTHTPGAFESIGWNDPAVVLKKIREYFEEVTLSKTESRWQWILVHKPRKEHLLHQRP